MITSSFDFGLGFTPGSRTGSVINRTGVAVTPGTVMCLDLLNTTPGEVTAANFGTLGSRNSSWANVTFSFAGLNNNAVRRNIYCVALEAAADNAVVKVMWTGITRVRCTSGGALTLGDCYLSSSPSQHTNGVITVVNVSPAATIKIIGWPLEPIDGAITDKLLVCLFDGVEGF